MRNLAGTSHAGSKWGFLSYWIDDTDNYVYQRQGFDGAWMGWLCHLSAWESTLSKAAWITLEDGWECPSEASHA